MNTATESEALENVRFNHLRNVAGSFLNETKALYLERDLVDFLVRIDKEHQEKIKQLELQLHIAITHKR